MAVPNIFATQTSSIPLSELDANFAYVENASGITYDPAGVGAVSRTAEAKLGESPSTADYGTGTQAVTALTSGVVVVPPSAAPTLPATFPTIVFDYYGPATPINVYQESGETTRFGKRVSRGQNAGSHNGTEYSLQVIEHHPVGSGTNGPTHADYALTVVNQKQDFTATAVVGEIDGINIVVRNGGATSDSAAILANVATYGTGFMCAMEASTSIIVVATVTQKIQTQIGLCDNVNAIYSGYYAKSVTGTNTEAFRCDSNAANLWTYMFRGFENGTEKFHISNVGVICLFDSSGNKKFIRCNSNNLSILNSAGSGEILSLSNTGALSIGSTFASGVAAVGGATVSATTCLNTLAGTTALSSLRIPHGAAPSAPVDGDMWSTTTTLNFRLNGVTKSITLT